MAMNNRAPIVLRARRACLAAAVVGVALAAGCNHRRSVLRPVMPAPRAVMTPGCSNCGGSGSTVITSPSSSVIRDDSIDRTSGEPSILEPAGSDSSVPLSPPSPTSSRRSPSPAAEAPPRATIDDPMYEEIAPAASATRSSRSLRPPVESKAKSTAPDLTSPAASSTGMRGTSNGLRTTSAAGVMRRASNSNALSQYFDGDQIEDLYYPTKADRPWKYVVVHHSATEEGSYAEIDAEHRKLLGLDGCGYHFVIGNGTGSDDGRIEVSQRWVNQKHGVHCRNARSAEIDEYGIGVCLIGDFEKAPPTPRQKAALKSLLAYLGDHYRIEQERMETHAHVAATPTVCPGRHFPADALNVLGPKFEAQASRIRTPDPTPTSAVRRQVPTAWRLQDGERESIRLTPPAR